MGSFWIEVFVGFVAAVVGILAARRFYPNKDHAFWRTGLVVAAVIYVVFSLVGGNLQWILIELGGVMVYLTFAVLSKRYSLWFLALGWALHVLWDLVLHGEGLDFVPAWYPAACLGFDIAIAAYVVWLRREHLVLQGRKSVVD
ncbi:MAG: hypothetical protein KTR30_09870 [Saprospiraceae bacterium]|nr:hypothetical protein [Saprospiraceae bacterium]